MAISSILLSLTAALQSVAPLPGPKLEPPVPLVTHRQLAERPSEFVGCEVRFVLQFHSIVEQWNPFVTRFSAHDYVGVEAWSDEQLPWIERDFERKAVRAFVRRGSFLDDFFRLGFRHERIAVRAVVREVFAGQPWIEILGAEATFESIPEGSILHVGRALEFERQGAYGLALSELERALSAPLPPRAAKAVRGMKERFIEARDKPKRR